MKKLILLGAFMCLSIVNATAQEVYKEILRLSEDLANNEKKSLELRRIAQFKVEELNYMAMKTKELMPDSLVSVLDYQAYAMYEYVNLFLNKLTRAKKKKDKAKVLALFKEASLANPRFNDMDQGVTMSYCDNGLYLTQFSLDTDWVKALAFVRTRMRAE